MRTLVLAALLLLACDVKMAPPRRELTDEEVREHFDRLGSRVVYFRDPRLDGACYATVGGDPDTMTSIDCALAEPLLVNPKRPATALDGGTP